MPADLIPPTFTCTVQPERQRVRVVLAGELDIETEPVVERQLDELREVGFVDLVLDLGGLSFADSTAVNLVLRWTRAAEAQGWHFEVAPGTGTAAELLSFTGVLEHLALDGPRRF
ncbi:STAS domain-containing protein [Conexibacter sp. SYSU D00693]|uniref:STAS domain-containing protein n=1 Tax=Conexibacter sp. SYSU D00693 TaxID=2812560 RepID=UPI00196A45D3|nr:STAS domain-containing protein [Conexibacter sp. SYSU D00693]